MIELQTGTAAKLGHGVSIRTVMVDPLNATNSPSVRLSERVFLLLPSAFSREPVSTLPGSEVFCLTLADLGAMMRGTPAAPHTGKIRIDLNKDEQRTYLNDDGRQQVLRSYSVASKVLAADMIDLDKLQNHLLLSAASLGGQLLRTYELGLDADGKPVPLTPMRVAEFLFDVLHGRIDTPLLDAKFSLASFGSAG